METVLIERAQQGDESAFAALFSQHKARVYKRCLQMLRNQADAEDLTQEIFLHLHQNIQKFDGKSAFSTWLYKMATNKVLMHLRAKDPDASSLDDIEREPADTRSAASTAVTEEIVSYLPLRLRSIFRMRVIEGYSVNETAQHLQVGPMVVVRKCGEAKEILRAKLSPETGQPSAVPEIPAAAVAAAVESGVLCSVPLFRRKVMPKRTPTERPAGHRFGRGDLENFAFKNCEKCSSDIRISMPCDPRMGSVVRYPQAHPRVYA